MEDRTTHPSERVPAHLIARPDGKFKAKLTQEDRYRAMAAVLTGIRKDVVAAAFGIDRRTISHMTNEYSKHYKSTREKVKQLGQGEFIRQFFDEDTLKKIQTVDLGTVQPSGPSSPGPNAPNPRASSKKGINVVKPEQCRHNHRIMIAFRPAIGDSAAGWWYQDLDGPNPTEWCRGDDSSLMTSQHCLAAAEAEIYDA